MTAGTIRSASSSVNGDGIITYGSYVGGKDVPSDQWVHVLGARAVLDDSFANLALKRKLDRGDTTLSEAATNAVVGRVAVADANTIRMAMYSAAEAAAEWRTMPLSVRVDGYLELMHSAITDNIPTIEHMLTLEGHPLELARWEISGMLAASSREARQFYREQLWRESTTGGQRQIIRRQPDGVVCVNPPANAPMVSALFAALSIASGNAMIVRAPRSVPLGIMYAIHDLLAPVLDEIGAPAGTVNAVCGHPGPLFDAWLESPLVNDIMYFGSSRTGVAFERRCVTFGKKPILELAGNDAVVVWRDANLDHAAQAVTEGFFGSGQLCMIPNQTVVHPAVADAFIDRVSARASALRPGYPDEEGVLLSPVLRHDAFRTCLDDALSKGAVLVSGGSGMSLDGSTDGAGFFLEPTVIRVNGLRRAREILAVEHETFFPLMPIIVPDADDDDELLTETVEFVNTNLYGLRNSVWATDDAVVERFLTGIVNGGLLKINDSHISFSPPLPSHGGTGLTGGVFGEANYPVLRTTHLQGVSIRSGATAPRYR
ncbi:aldehyde dehydrogenase family protein [Nocardia pseudovaccinii]|uniref:aldehyde dehydrogenase family protein n=1 Tax=Nocardia pseudovaccinii TaxID=189540 RepID=UPI003D913AF6